MPRENVPRSMMRVMRSKDNAQSNISSLSLPNVLTRTQALNHMAARTFFRLYGHFYNFTSERYWTRRQAYEEMKKLLAAIIDAPVSSPGNYDGILYSRMRQKYMNQKFLQICKAYEPLYPDPDRAEPKSNWEEITPEMTRCDTDAPCMMLDALCEGARTAVNENWTSMKPSDIWFVRCLQGAVGVFDIERDKFLSQIAWRMTGALDGSWSIARVLSSKGREHSLLDVVCEEHEAFMDSDIDRNREKEGDNGLVFSTVMDHPFFRHEALVLDELKACGLTFKQLDTGEVYLMFPAPEGQRSLPERQEPARSSKKDPKSDEPSAFMAPSPPSTRPDLMEAYHESVQDCQGVVKGDSPTTSATSNRANPAQTPKKSEKKSPARSAATADNTEPSQTTPRQNPPAFFKAADASLSASSRKLFFKDAPHEAIPARPPSEYCAQPPSELFSAKLENVAPTNPIFAPGTDEVLTESNDQVMDEKGVERRAKSHSNGAAAFDKQGSEEGEVRPPLKIRRYPMMFDEDPISNIRRKSAMDASVNGQDGANGLDRGDSPPREATPYSLTAPTSKPPARNVKSTSLRYLDFLLSTEPWATALEQFKTTSDDQTKALSPRQNKPLSDRDEDVERTPRLPIVRYFTESKVKWHEKEAIEERRRTSHLAHSLPGLVALHCHNPSSKARGGENFDAAVKASGLGLSAASKEPWPSPALAAAGNGAGAGAAEEMAQAGSSSTTALAPKEEEEEPVKDESAVAEEHRLLHGVRLSIESTDPWPNTHLQQLSVETQGNDFNSRIMALRKSIAGSQTTQSSLSPQAAAATASTEPHAESSHAQHSERKDEAKRDEAQKETEKEEEKAADQAAQSPPMTEMLPLVAPEEQPKTQENTDLFSRLDRLLRRKGDQASNDKKCQ